MAALSSSSPLPRSWAATLVLLLQALVATSDARLIPRSLEVNGYSFDCLYDMPEGRPLGVVKGTVLFLHGFPESMNVWKDFMRRFGMDRYASLACNQRGYSPGASPDDKAEYSYPKLRDDVFGFADAMEWDTFHLVGHDHGAILGWYCFNDKERSKRILSYSALSVPHIDAFSQGLCCGEGVDEEQQAASQYMTVWVEPDAATQRDNFFFDMVKAAPGFIFTTPEELQRAMYWYNGAIDVGALANVPVLSMEQVEKYGGFGQLVRTLFPQEPAPGTPQLDAQKAGRIEVPVSFVCGGADTFLLCKHPFATKTKDYCVGDYEHVVVENCSHDIHSCEDPAATDQSYAAILATVKKAASISKPGPVQPTPVPQPVLVAYGVYSLAGVLGVCFLLSFVLSSESDTVDSAWNYMACLTYNALKPCLGGGGKAGGSDKQVELASEKA